MLCPLDRNALVELTLSEALPQTSQRYPAREALNSRHRKLRYTWREVDEAVTRVAQRFIRPGS
jgi:hypothetical protein